MTWDRSVVYSINKTDHHEITEILLKVALNTINLLTLIVEWLAQFLMIHRHEGDQDFILSCTCSIWAGKLHWLENFCYLHFFVHDTVIDRNIAFSGTPVTWYLLSFGNLIVNPAHFLLTENIKRGNQGIIV